MSDPVSAAQQALATLAAQSKRRTKAQTERYEQVKRVSERIQERGVRPVDGVTFAKQTKGKQ